MKDKEFTIAYLTREDVLDMNAPTVDDMLQEISDKKQIDLMLGDCLDLIKDIPNKSIDLILWHSRAIAEHLIGQGYRKIPEGAVVLTREEYQKDFSSQFNKGYKHGSKETAKEILQDLYIEATSNISETVELTTFQIEQLAKQYGVDLGE